MVDATLVTNDGMNYALDGLRRPLPNEVHETAGGHLMLAGEFRFIWKQLSEVCGVTDGLGADASLDEKIAARRAASHEFFNVTCADRAAVIAALDEMNIAWGDVRTAADTRELASVIARDTIAEVDDRAGGTRPIPQSPYHFARGEAYVRGGAPHLGEHNADVLGDWLGMNAEETAAWQDVLIQKLPEAP